jgi:hypothetical protein
MRFRPHEAWNTQNAKRTVRIDAKEQDNKIKIDTAWHCAVKAFWQGIFENL